MIPTSQIIRIGVALVLLLAVFVAYQVGYWNGTGIDGIAKMQDGQSVATESRMLFGTIDEVDGKELTLKDVKRIPGSASDATDTVTVTVDSATVIERLVPKDSATLEKEQAAFLKSVETQQGSTESIVPPEPFTRTKVAFSSLKAGDFVVVSSNQDLSKLSVFTATRIDVQDTPLSSPVTNTTTTTTAIKVDEGSTPPPPLPEGIVKPQ